MKAWRGAGRCLFTAVVLLTLILLSAAPASAVLAREKVSDFKSLAAKIDFKTLIEKRELPVKALEMGSASISGTVTGPSQEPLSDIMVFAFGINAGDVGWAFTDAGGSYQIPALFEDDYIVWFMDTNSVYAFEFYNDVTDINLATLVSAYEFQTTSGINAQLIVGGAIEGTVIDNRGVPVSDTVVLAFDNNLWLASLAVTDAVGHYRLGGLPTGSYVVFFGDSRYVAEFYNDATTLNQATLVLVTAPDTVTGIDSSLQRRVTNDADGDARSDAIALYNYGGGSSGAWVFNTREATGANSLNLALSPAAWWRSTGAMPFDPTRLKAVTGDFNGDGEADIIALKNEGTGKSSLYLWKSTGRSFEAAKKVFYSGAWNWSNTKLVSGDFNGDGKDELFAFYTYGGSVTGVFVFEQNPDGSFRYPRKVFYSPYWNWGSTTLLSVKENGVSKVVAAYNYGGSKTGLWLFEINEEDGKLLPPRLIFVSKYWSFSNATFLTGDVNGDQRSDIIAFYNYGGTTTGVFIFRAITDAYGRTSYANPASVYISKTWSYTNSTFIPGDFDGDNLADAAAVYNYGGGSMAIWVFRSNGVKFSMPVKIFNTPYWNNAATKWLMPY